jgi:hypothetical protein
VVLVVWVRYPNSDGLVIGNRLEIFFGGSAMKSARWILIAAVVSFFAAPAALFADRYWDGGGTTNLWSEAANWSDDGEPNATSGSVFIGDMGGTITKMPEVDAGTALAASACYVGHNRYGWAGPGSLTVSGGTLKVLGQGLAVGVDWKNGAVTQTGGQVLVSNEVSLGHESNFGSYTISGGSLNAGAHLLITDAGTSSGLFQVNGTGATSITVSYQLYFRNGTGELKFVLGPTGVTPITASRLIVNSGAGRGPRTLTVDSTGYTGPETDIVLVDYRATTYWDGKTFNTVNLIGSRTMSIAYGTVLSSRLTVHVGPDPALMAAQSPSPADSAAGVDPNVVLSWLPGAGFDPISDLHKVYLAAGTSGTDLPGTPTATISSATFDPNPDLGYQTQYVWRVDEVIDGATYTGSVWTFTTAPKICIPQLLADTNGDCVVDMADFAKLAAEWLSCTLSNGDCP